MADGPVQVTTMTDDRGKEKSAHTTRADMRRHVQNFVLTIDRWPLTTPRRLFSDFVRVDDLGDERAREAAPLLGMGRANPRFDRAAP